MGLENILKKIDDWKNRRECDVSAKVKYNTRSLIRVYPCGKELRGK